MTAARPPILVTGTHRSGTTWVGQMLALSDGVHYVHEPFAPMHERAWVRRPPQARYAYRRATDGAWELDEDLDRIVRLRPSWVTIARRAGGLRNYARVGQEAVETAVARMRGARALIKDPFALLLAEWIADRSDAAMVVLVRHPAAFVSSVKRLNWRMDTSYLLQQPELMADHLEPFRAELERDSRRENDLVDHACLVWRTLNSIVYDYERRHPAWAVLRYEDLAEDPVDSFRHLYGDVGIDWSSTVERKILDQNAPRHGADVPAGSKGGTQRDSVRAMWTWTSRLTPAEAARIRRATSELGERWYPDEYWTAPRSRPCI